MKLNSIIRSSLLLAGLFFSQGGFAGWWVPVLSCDNGAARVEVDLGERRNVQIVITNNNIRDYLYKSGVIDFIPNGDNRDYIGAYVDQGIFNSSQFTGFMRKGVSPTCSSGFAPTLKVYKEGRGLKLIAEQESAEGCCFNSDSVGNCTDKGPDVPWKMLANWYFQNCTEIQIP